MKPIKFLLILAWVLPVFFCQNLGAEVVDRVVAVVNGAIITESELEETIVPLRNHYTNTINSKRKLKQKLEETRKLTLEQFIEKKLLLGKVEEEGIEVNEGEVEKTAGELKERFPTGDKFQEWLKSQNLSEQSLKKQVREQKLIRELINKKLRPDIKISPEEIKIYYNRNKDKFNEDARVNLSYILVKGPPERGDGEAEYLIREVWEKLMQGEEFSSLSKQYSDGPKHLDGGNLEFIGVQTLPPELRKIVEGLEVGETTEIIRSPSGFNIIKLNGKKEARERELVEIESLIEDQIFREKLEGKYQIWLGELKKEAYIERK